MPDNIVLIMRFHPVGGEDVFVVSEDFAGESEALEAIAARWTNGAAWSWPMRDITARPTILA